MCIIKATIKFVENGVKRQKTIDITKNEPNSIIRELARVIRIRPYTYITTIKCGRREYQWYGIAKEANIL